MVAVVFLLNAALWATAGERVSLRRVYQERIFAPETGTPPYAQFDATGEIVYLIEPNESRVRLIDWRKGKGLHIRQYAEIPCSDSTPGMHAIHEWRPLNGIVLMRYCGSLYLLDSKTLNVKHKLEAGEEAFGEVAFSPDGAHIAVVVADSKWTWNNRRIRIYKIETLAPIAEWPVTHWANHLTFSPDGRYLVSTIVELEPPMPGQKVYEQKGCRLVAWRTDTWEVESQTALVEGGKRRALDCPWRVTFIPEHDAFLDALPTELQVRDLRGGAVLKSIRTDRVLIDLAVSHNGRWVAANVKNELFQGQDFRIVDLETGKIAYQSSRILRPRSGALSFSWSRDDRYLLVTRLGEIEIYETQQ